MLSAEWCQAGRRSFSRIPIWGVPGDVAVRGDPHSSGMAVMTTQRARALSPSRRSSRRDRASHSNPAPVTANAATVPIAWSQSVTLGVLTPARLGPALYSLVVHRSG